MAEIWKTHIIQSKIGVNETGRRPFLMYTIPQMYGAENHLCSVDEAEVAICAEETVQKKSTCADDTIFELCSLFMEDNNLSKPSDSNEAKSLYIHLRRLIRTELDRLNWETDCHSEFRLKHVKSLVICNLVINNRENMFLSALWFWNNVHVLKRFMYWIKRFCFYAQEGGIFKIALSVHSFVFSSVLPTLSELQLRIQWWDFNDLDLWILVIALATPTFHFQTKWLNFNETLQDRLSQPSFAWCLYFPLCF